MRISTFILCLIGGFVIFTLIWGVSNMSNNTASIEQNKSVAVQSQSNAQIEAARQQAIVAQSQQASKDYATQLSTQLTSQTNSMTLTIAMIVVGAVLVIGALGGIIFMINWVDTRQSQRSLLFLQERQALLLEQARVQQEQFILMMNHSVPSNLSLPDRSTVENTVLNIPSIVRNNRG